MNEYQPSSETACLLWLKQQQKFLSYWEEELVAAQAEPSTLEALTRHAHWLDNMINSLSPRSLSTT